MPNLPAPVRASIATVSYPTAKTFIRWKSLISSLLLGGVMSLGLLSGCASMGDADDGYVPPAVQLEWDVRKDRLQQFNNWRLSARAASADDIFGFSGDVTWQQRGNTFDISGSGPLGIGGFRAKGTPDRVLLQTPEGTQVSNNPARDMQNQLGWRIPLEALRYWVLGLPWSPDGSNNSSQANLDSRFEAEFDPAGRLLRLQQAGWTITYQRYAMQDFLGIDLPVRLLVEDPNDDYNIKMLIEQWQPL